VAKPKAEAAIRAAVEGRVRGVGFRDATVARAGELGLQGWVRHAVGGEGVTVHAEGDEAGVEALTRFLEKGPGDADVASVAVERVKPEGHEQFAIRGVSAGRFTVAEIARGFELRLEVDGATRAWAVPKGPSLDPAAKRMAIALDAPAGDGERDIWDEGDYEQGGRVPWPEAIDRGHAVFVLHGERLRGGFALQRTGRGEKARWLLIKRRDEEARPGSG
jgi:DNA ligase D-like protein (predicted 3'-phosphoesterase)